MNEVVEASGQRDLEVRLSQRDERQQSQVVQHDHLHHFPRREQEANFRVLLNTKSKATLITTRFQFIHIVRLNYGHENDSKIPKMPVIIAP